MRDASRVTAPECRLEYSALLRAAQTCADDGVFNAKHKAHLEVWCMLALTANALCTDDSYAFNKTAAEVKAAIAELPGTRAGHAHVCVFSRCALEQTKTEHEAASDALFVRCGRLRASCGGGRGGRRAARAAARC